MTSSYKLLAVGRRRHRRVSRARTQVASARTSLRATFLEPVETIPILLTEVGRLLLFLRDVRFVALTRMPHPDSPFAKSPLGFSERIIVMIS